MQIPIAIINSVRRPSTYTKRLGQMQCCRRKISIKLSLVRAGDNSIDTLDLLFYNAVNKLNRLFQLFLFIKIISSPAIAKTVCSGSGFMINFPVNSPKAGSII